MVSKIFWTSWFSDFSWMFLLQAPVVFFGHWTMILMAMVMFLAACYTIPGSSKKNVPFHHKNLPKGRNSTYLEDPGISMIRGKGYDCQWEPLFPGKRFLWPHKPWHSFVVSITIQTLNKEGMEENETSTSDGGWDGSNLQNIEPKKHLGMKYPPWH